MDGIIRFIFRNFSIARKPICDVARWSNPEGLYAQFGDLVWSKKSEVRQIALRGISLKEEELSKLFYLRVIPYLGRAILADSLLHKDMMHFEEWMRVQLLQEILLSGNLKEFENAIDLLLKFLPTSELDPTVSAEVFLYRLYKQISKQMHPVCREALMELANINEKEEAPTDPEMPVLILDK